MRSLVWFLLAFVLASGVLSTSLWRELRAERLMAVSLQAQLSEANARPEPAAPSAPLAAPAITAVVATAASKPIAAVAKSAPATALDTALRNALSQQRELWKDPEYRKARLAQMRAGISRSYPGLAEDLGISDAQADKLFELMAEYEMNGELSVLPDSGASEQQKYLRQRDEGIAALLGPAKTAQWQQYEQTLGERSRANSIGSMLSQAGQPLTSEQLKALTAALIRESPHQETTATSSTSSQDQAARAAESSQRVLAAAASILNAQQLAAVSTQIEQQNAMSRALARARDRAVAAQAQQ